MKDKYRVVVKLNNEWQVLPEVLETFEKAVALHKQHAPFSVIYPARTYDIIGTSYIKTSSYITYRDAITHARAMAAAMRKEKACQAAAASCL